MAVLIAVSMPVIYAGTAGSTVKADDYETREYTEEEKAQAKAWLSAHGYPPTRAGAQMAYQDYLNGKFDNDPEVQRYLGKEVKITEAVNDDSTTPDSKLRSEEPVKTYPPVSTSGRIVVTTTAVITETTEEVITTSDEDVLNTEGDTLPPVRAGPDNNRVLKGILLLAAGLMAAVGIILYIRFRTA